MEPRAQGYGNEVVIDNLKSYVISLQPASYTAQGVTCCLVLSAIHGQAMDEMDGHWRRGIDN